jgi:hypothetical protein
MHPGATTCSRAAAQFGRCAFQEGRDIVHNVIFNGLQISFKSRLSMRFRLAFHPFSLLLLGPGSVLSQSLPGQRAPISASADREVPVDSGWEFHAAEARARLKHSLKVASLRDVFDGAAFSASNNKNFLRGPANQCQN